MIASITGTLTRKAADHLIIDVSGIGYQVQVPLSTFYALPDTGQEVSLLIFTQLREDSLALYGFSTQEEKDAFLLLNSVSGIGPRLSLALLSSLSVGDLVQSITSGDDARLCAIPGVGKKTAGRIVLELKDKARQLVPTGAAPAGAALQGSSQGDADDAVSALINLGYKKNLAEDAVARTRRSRPSATVEELLREALAALIKR